MQKPIEVFFSYSCEAKTLQNELEIQLNDLKGIYREHVTEVGMFPPNEFGLYDMHGNIWEWCADCWHDNYEDAPQDGSAWLTASDSSNRLLRGGSWLDYPRTCRSAFRTSNLPDERYDYFGFRVVCI